jgi:hypothetical protein
LLAWQKPHLMGNFYALKSCASGKILSLVSRFMLD